MRNFFVSLVSSAILAGLLASPGATQQPEKPDLDRLLQAVKQKGNVDARIQALVDLAEFGPKAEPALPDLLECLQDKNEDLRLNAAITLAKVGPAAVKPVALLLESTDDDVKFYAIWTIGWIGPEAKATVPTMIKLAANKNEGIRRKAIFALGRLAGDPEKTIDVLVGAFKDESDEVRQAAGDALAKLGKPAVPALMDILKTGTLKAQIQASTSLGEIGADAKDAVPLLKERFLATTDRAPHHYAPILGKLGKEGVKALEVGFKDERADVRAAASQSLQQVGADAVGVLVDSLGDKNVEVRRLAAQTLWPMRIGDKSVVIALAFALADEDDQVKQMSINALAQLGIQAKLAAPKLKDALTDMNPQVRMQAYNLLKHQINDDPGPTLKKALESKSDKIRINTASLMVSVGFEKNLASPILIEALKHEDLGLRMQAASTLAQQQQQKDKVLPIFIEGLKHKAPGVRLQAVQGINSFGQNAGSAAPAIARMLADPDANVRQTAVYTLHHVRGTPEAVMPILGGMFKDGNPETRRMVLQAVYVYGDKAMDLVIDGLKDKDNGVRQQAVNSLQNVRGTPEKMVPILTAVYKDGDAAIKRSVVSIAYLYGEKALDLVTTALKDKDASVRQQAVWSLQNVRGTPEKMVPILTTAYQDGDVNVKRAIIQIIHIYGVKGKDLVLVGLKDKDSSIRQQSIWALQNMQGDLSDALPALVEALKDKELAGLRHQIVWLMSRTGEAGVPYLGGLLKDSDVNTRVQAAQVLRNLGPKVVAKALPAIKEAINDSNASIRTHCMYLVAASGGDGPEFLVKQIPQAKEPGVRANLLQALVQANHKKLVAPLLKTTIKDEAPEVRQATVYLLGSFGNDSEEAFDAFKIGLKDSDRQVHVHAARLGSFYGDKCHAPLEESLKTAQNSDFRQAILQSLGNSSYRSKTGVPAVIECLKDNDANVHIHACNVLASIGPDAAAALPMLRKLANGTNQPVQKAAMMAVKRIESK